jgi:hypothetical protein
MLRCRRCNEHKPEDSFNKDGSRPTGRCLYCRECSRAKGKQYYAANPHKKLQIRENSKASKRRQVKALLEYFDSHPCVDCGEKDPRVLEFDHQRDKTRNVSEMISNSCSWPTILIEIEKCHIVCASCHRRRTAIDQNWYGLVDPTKTWYAEVA